MASIGLVAAGLRELVHVMLLDEAAALKDISGEDARTATPSAALRLSIARRRRIVSTAYYALFHALCDLCVRSFIPEVGSQSTLSIDVRNRIYRAIEHSSAKKACKRLATRKDSSELLRAVCNGFVQLQEARHDADYQPDSFRLDTSVVGSLAVVLVDSLGALEALGAIERQQLATELLFRER